MPRLPIHQRLIEAIHDRCVDSINDAMLAMQDDTEKILRDAIDRSGLDLSTCRICSQLVVCVPDGISNICEACSAKEAKASG